ncbi:MAG: lactonase family protein [Clostridia bacterium]|nr:lactonase family protein [Clostridia bacterium]
MTPPFELFIASCKKEGGVYRYGIEEGKMPKQLGFTPMDRPMYMTLSENRLYVLLRAPFEGSEESGLALCDITADGQLLPPAAIRSTKGQVACHLTVKNETVWAVNYTSGSVIKIPGKTVTHRGRSVNQGRQSAPHPHFVSFTPDGAYLAVTDLGTDEILLYDADLILQGKVSLPKGAGPRHLAFHEDGKHLFCANELTSTVSLLQYEKGALTLLSTVSALPPSFHGESTAAAIRCMGDRLFVSNRGHDSVSLLHFSNGTLSLQKNLSTYGASPRDFLICGDLLIAANEASHSVSLISLETQELISTVPVPSPLCLVIP